MKFVGGVYTTSSDFVTLQHSGLCISVSKATGYSQSELKTCDAQNHSGTK